jgi:hypothetical protein
VKEINATESPGDDRVNIVAKAFDLNLGSPSHVREYIAFSELDESKLDIVGVRRVILEEVVRN